MFRTFVAPNPFLIHFLQGCHTLMYVNYLCELWIHFNIELAPHAVCGFACGLRICGLMHPLTNQASKAAILIPFVCHRLKDALMRSTVFFCVYRKISIITYLFSIELVETSREIGGAGCFLYHDKHIIRLKWPILIFNCVIWPNNFSTNLSIFKKIKFKI